MKLSFKDIEMAPKKSKVSPKISGPDLVAIRKHYRLNQYDFWRKVTCTQSGGSRYESGRDLPDSVEVLVRVIYLAQNLDKALGAVNSRTAVNEKLLTSSKEAKMQIPTEVKAKLSALKLIHNKYSV